MVSLMDGPDPEASIPTKWLPVSLEALDRESLLVEWLNELLYLAEREGLLPLAFEIELLTETTLEGRVGGIPARETEWDIKAATYHDLALQKEDGGWSMRITFDV